ncbi:hypothetical protein [Agaribacterium haliotis]|uniref:hypothetical protein n=1 Tax=Agaribacterium haliotis TaxID=2013869 RepID=UPI000BB5894C|nr:hypothetical protein [Agaribacterium haliotis]
MSEAFPEEAIEAKKNKFIEGAKQSILSRLRPIIEYKVRETIAPGTIDEAMELNQYYVDSEIDEREQSGKPTHQFKSFAQFSKEQRGE